MPKIINTIGQKFNNLTVIEIVERMTSGDCLVMCRCDCGSLKKYRRSNLLSGNTKSCGCGKKGGSGVVTHGLTDTKIYNKWRAMIQRCNNPKNPRFKDYGGRGISVCERWMKFEDFYEDMKVGYSDELSLERDDNDGDYEKSNCRWATNIEQQNNKKGSIKLTINGQVGSISKWSEISGEKYNIIYNRYKKGYSHKECVYGLRKDELN